MKYIITIVLIFSFFLSQGQNKHHSIHQEHNDRYKHLDFKTDKEWDDYHQYTPKKVEHKNLNCTNERIVFGWHPYWVGSAHLNYDWDLMTDFSFFSYEVDAATGQANSTHGWATAESVDMALANGVRVNLCVTLFSDHTIFFASATAKQTLITNLINMVQSRGAHGVNIDFEGVPIAEKNNYTNWLIDLSTQMKAVDPNYQISIATYAVDWSGLFDVVALKDYIDLFCIMGYGYYWAGSTYAGPTDPLYTFMTSYNYSLSRTLTYYLDQGVPKDQLVLGLPYYGRQWQTTASTIPTTTTAHDGAKFFNSVMDNSSGNYSNRLWDNNSFTPYYSFMSGGIQRQCFIMDGPSLEDRLDLINRRDIAGMAIWALGYDDGYTDLWDAIRNKLTDCKTVECTGTIYDMGGPNRNYYNDEDYEYTIAPDGAQTVTLDFLSFDVELNYDYLYLYDGASSSAPLIGTYTGTDSPGTVTSTGPTLTLKFYSDGATVNPGWEANWSCSYEYDSPTCEIVGVPECTSDDFSISFNDTPGTNANLDRQFIQVCDHIDGEWRTNANNGYVNDDFKSLHADWTSYDGTWSRTTNWHLLQSDETKSNTIFSMAMNQNNSDEYLYHWSSSIDGTGTNRRAGLHFLCDDPQLPNRGNSYFVYYRIDSDKLQLYEVNNDTYTLVSNIDYVFNLNQRYDFKITFNTLSGKMDVFIDDEFVTSWTDATPLSGGDYISFRSGNCMYDVDFIRVYQSRTNVRNITVGYNNPTNDIQSMAILDPQKNGYIRSMIIDSANKISNTAHALFRTDYVFPYCNPIIFDPKPLGEISSAPIKSLREKEEMEQTITLEVFPNPSNGRMNIMIKNSSENEGKIQIMDASGRWVLQKNIPLIQGENRISIEEFEFFPKGMYHLQFITENQILSQKLIKL